MYVYRETWVYDFTWSVSVSVYGHCLAEHLSEPPAAGPAGEAARRSIRSLTNATGRCSLGQGAAGEIRASALFVCVGGRERELEIQGYR